MMKKLLTVFTVICAVAVNAQNIDAKVIGSGAYLLPSNSLINDKTTSSPPGCAVISIVNPSVNFSIYSVTPSTLNPGCSPFAGYLFGTNCYGFKETATFFSPSSYSAVTSPSVSNMLVGFYRNPVNGAGTHGTVGTVSLNIYAGTSNTLAPGSLITSTTVSLGSIIAAQNPTSNVISYIFTLTPTAVPATGFFASLAYPTAIGDTAVVVTQTTSASTSTVPNAWLYNAAGTWSSVATAVGANLNHLFLPNICGIVVATGISTNLGLSKDVKIMPNPSTGLVNITLALAQTENIHIAITNALGQQIIAKQYDGISSEMLTLDLTSQPNGVYFVTINNGKDKMVQRLILNR